MSIILTLKRMAGTNVSSYFCIGVDIHSDSQTLIKSPNSLQVQLEIRGRGLAVRVLFVSRRGLPEAALHYGQL